jgi:hypothetical protein
MLNDIAGVPGVGGQLLVHRGAGEPVGQGEDPDGVEALVRERFGAAQRRDELRTGVEGGQRGRAWPRRCDSRSWWRSS